MAKGKKLFLSAVLLFGAIGVVGLWKKGEERRAIPPLVQEIPLVAKEPIVRVEEKREEVFSSTRAEEETLPEADQVARLFALDSSKFPFVETVSYSSRVPWLKERPAWIADYASHFATSRHFIARSLNRKPDYLTQKVAPGDRFNVFRRDKEISFHLVIDLSRCKLWFYAVDLGENLKYLLKTYRVGLGRLDPKRASGSLTPVGTYSLGEKIAIYKPGVYSHFQGREEEMIRIFGTRWIPFDREIEGCTEAAKGFGIHGAPWVLGEKGLVEELDKIGRYESDGCVRLASADVEEIFAIVVTKPTYVHLVKSFYEAKVPGMDTSETLNPLQVR